MCSLHGSESLVQQELGQSLTTEACYEAKAKAKAKDKAKAQSLLRGILTYPYLCFQSLPHPAKANLLLFVSAYPWEIHANTLTDKRGLFLHTLPKARVVSCFYRPSSTYASKSDSSNCLRQRCRAQDPLLWCPKPHLPQATRRR